MPRSIYTLKKLVNEFKLLIGCELIECFSQEKDSIDLLFYDGDEEYYIEYSADNKYGGVYVRADFKRANKNTISLFDELNGEVLQGVELYNNDRIIKFQFINSIVYAVMFSGGRANFIIADLNNIIINSLNNKKEIVGRSIDEILPKQVVKPKEITSVEEYISYYPYWLPKIYIKDFIDKNSEISLEDNEKLDKAVETYIDSLLSSKDNYLYRIDRKLIISFIEIQDADVVYKSETISKVVQKYLSYSKSESSFNEEFKQLKRDISKKYKQFKSKYEIYSNYRDSEDRSKKYRLYGEILLSQLNLKEKVGKEVILNDWDGNEIIIKLDEKKSLLDNGNNYFKKSKSAQKESAIRQKLLPETEKNFHYYSTLMEKLNLCSNYKDLKAFKKEFNIGLAGINDNYSNKKSSGNQGKMNTENRFKEFDLGEGYILYVGKNAANNDELSMKFAKPNDYWFHARGSSGSHCVLKPIGKEVPPKYILTKAAQIAAYYSKSRNAKYTPVAYTQKKYVRKPKGANIGAVTISKEKVIMVEPKLEMENK